MIWNVLYWGGLVGATFLLTTDWWHLGVGWFLGVAISSIMDRILRRARRTRDVARACAELCFVYQAILAARMITQYMEDGKMASDEERWKQKFWARAAIRYSHIARGHKPFTK